MEYMEYMEGKMQDQIEGAMSTNMDDALFVTGARSKRQLAEWLGVPEFHCDGAAKIPDYLVKPIREFIAKNVELTRVA